MKIRAPLAFLLFLSMIGLLAASTAAADEGLAKFEALKCNMCHPVAKHNVAATIKKVEMQGPDLSNVGAEHDVEWLKKWLLGEEKIDDKPHKSKWKGTPQDLEVLSAWLAALKE